MSAGVVPGVGAPVAGAGVAEQETGVLESMFPMNRPIVAQFWFVLIALFLTACGGGEESALYIPGESDYQLSLSSDSGTVSGNKAVKVTATLKNPDGAPVGGAYVSFLSDVGRLAVTTAQTNSQGLAVVELYAGTGGYKEGQVKASYLDPEKNLTPLAVLPMTTQGDQTIGGGNTTPGVASVALTMTSTDGRVIDATNPVMDTSSAKLRATVKNADGTPAASVIVTFNVESGLATLSQQTMLTNASGVAEVSVTATAAGAGLATASAVISSAVTVTGSVVFASALESVSQLILDLGYKQGATFTSGALGSSASGPVASGSVVTITADIVDTETNAAYTGPVNVKFDSICVQNGRATIDNGPAGEGIFTVNGRATAVYRPAGCVGGDTVTATVVNGTQNLTARTTITMAPEGIASILFASATKTDLALKGTGSSDRSETSTLTFRVSGEQGGALAGALVCFGLSTDVGGIILTTSEASTNQSGDASTTIVAGTIPTPVRVSAHVDTDADNNCATRPAQLVQTVSSELRISTGLPHQNSFSLSISAAPTSASKSPAYDYDGIEYDVLINAADRFNNPVPEGTAISFWTELGAIQPSCTADENGYCSVRWKSQSPRTSTDGGRCGRSTILAYAVGEESFVDSNGNGRYDAGETIVQQQGEAIKDINLNGTRESGEEFLDFNKNGTYDGPNTQYDGVLCGSGGNCSGKASVHVRDYSEIVMSANSARLYLVHPSAGIGNVPQLTAPGTSCDAVFNSITNPVDANYDYNGQVVSRIRVGSSVALKGTAFRLIATDRNGNQLAPGTKITVSVGPSTSKVGIDTSGGYKDSYTVTAGDAWFDELFFLKIELGPDLDGSLRATIDHTDGTVEIFDLAIIDRDAG